MRWEVRTAQIIQARGLHYYCGVAPVPDAEATLARARKEAAIYIVQGRHPFAVVCHAIIKLASGVQGERYYALDAAMVQLLHPTNVVERIEP